MEPCLFKFLLSLGTNSRNKKLGQVECAINGSSFLLNEAALSSQYLGTFY